MEISTAAVRELRQRCGAGIMDCRSALIEANGDMDKAGQILRERGLAKAEEKRGRTAKEGLIESYIHEGRIGAMVEVNCETDFVARTDEFKNLAHDLAMQVVAMSPAYLSQEDVPSEERERASELCLLAQPFIRDPSKTIQEVITETMAKVCENITVGRFIRFELGA